tara:strand:- start:6695 stop:6979 length:285 start_codon:yes stop_codon:yes gene_type:complete
MTANTESVVDVISGVPGIRRVIKELWFEQDADRRVTAYVDQEQIVDVWSQDGQAVTNAIPVERELKEGETFKVGALDSDGSATAHEITTFYEES